MCQIHASIWTSDMHGHHMVADNHMSVRSYKIKMVYPPCEIIRAKPGLKRKSVASGLKGDFTVYSNFH